MRFKCEKCGSKKFIVSFQEWVDYEVDENGNVLRQLGTQMDDCTYVSEDAHVVCSECWYEAFAVKED